MKRNILCLTLLSISFTVFAQEGKQIIQSGRKALTNPKNLEGVRLGSSSGVTSQIASSLQRATQQAVGRIAGPGPEVQSTAKAAVGAPWNRKGILPARVPRRNLINKRYPSGLRDEEQLIDDWLEYFRNDSFHTLAQGEDDIEGITPRDQVEAIEGMTPRQMNNIIEYLYYMPLEEAKAVIFNPLLETGRLPEFMYDDKLILGTQRLPAGYYKNKFNKNVKNLIELAKEDGTIFTHNAKLKELISTMRDYTFAQGFSYKNCPELTNGLRKNWEIIMAEIRKPGINSANRALVNRMWNKPVALPDGKTVTLKEYFTQTRKTKFFEQAVPEFYLNSPKWVALENERRNLIARAYPFIPEEASAFNRLHKRFVLGNPDNYLTLEQFGQMMTQLYQKAHGQARRTVLEQMILLDQQQSLEGVSSLFPSSTKIKINNFDKIGGVCQMSFMDGGYAGRVDSNYDGTSLVDRYSPVVFENVKVVTFDMYTLQPRVVTIQQVSYVKDLKEPDIEKVRASSMVGDGLDESRDVLTMEQAEKALHNVRHLKATVYPHGRVSDVDKIPYMYGGGLAGYLALFTPDFYPIKTVKLWRKVDGTWKRVPTHFIRKEVLTLAGFVHRDFLTFTEQVEDRIVKGQ